MRYGEKRMALRDGRICLLRSPGAEDAGAMLDYLRDIAGETHFLIRYPEEVRMDPAEEADFLEQQRRPDSRSVMIAAFMDGVVAGDVSVSPAGGQQKLRHRASLGIAVRQPCWSLGLGRILMKEALEAARQMGYAQLELGVFADNLRAAALYESLGFQEWGRMRNAFRLKDGTMVDEILMGLML